MMRFRLTSCLLTVLVTSCFSLLPEEEAEPITFRNVRINLISQLHKTNQTVFVTEAKTLSPFVISNNTDTIRINHQEIPMLYQNSITGIRNVAVLDFSSNSIQGIEEGTFGNLGLVQALNLSSNLIRVVRSDVFTHVDVKYLFLSHNRIFKIEDRAFESLDHLYFIDLSSNRIRNWKWTWFRGTPVKGINMGHNLLEQLPEDSFKFLDDLDIPSHRRILHHLLFDHNNIKSIHEFSLPVLKKLVHFDLSHNWLVTIPIGTFNSVSSVDRLDLSYNYIMYLDRRLFKNTDVGYVNLKSNYLFFINTDYIPMINLDLNPLNTTSRRKWMDWKRKYGYILDSPEYSS